MLSRFYIPWRRFVSQLGNGRPAPLREARVLALMLVLIRFETLFLFLFAAFYGVNSSRRNESFSWGFIAIASKLVADEGVVEPGCFTAR